MKLRQATLLAATGSALSLALQLEAVLRNLRYMGLFNGVDLLLGLFVGAALTLMLFMIYSEMEGRKPWLSVKESATWAAVGCAFWTAWSIYEPFAGRFHFPTVMLIMHWVVGVTCLRFGWTVLCAMIASADPRTGQVALVLIVPQAFSGIWDTWFLRIEKVIILFEWLTLCAFLFESWRGGRLIRDSQDLSHTSRSLP